ncbi:MAG: hypothetical protein L6Q51_03435 [Cyclobacteriaceae bacterium]|nr:hypothetical protein [Cyclobacteriaceae bacterium]
MSTLTTITDLVVISIVLFWVWRKDSSTIKKFYWPAAIFKLVAGMAVGFIHYRYYAQSDTVQFYESALQLREMALRDVTTYLKMLVAIPDGYFLGENRTLLFVKLVSVTTLFTGGNYYLSSLFFSLLSFLAAWNLALWITRLNPALAIPAVVALLFFPSCVFWSSGILKESLAMAGLFYLASFSIKLGLRHQLTLLNILLVVPALWIVWSLKYYYAAVFIPAAMALLLTQYMIRKFKQTAFISQVFIFLAVLAFFLLLGGLLHPNLKTDRVPHVVYETHQLALAQSKPDNLIHYNSLRPTWGGLLLHTPHAFVSGLFAPVIPRFSNFLQVLSVIESVMLLVLTFFSFPTISRLPDTPNRLWVVAVLVYIALLAVFISLSTPNVGTLVRYRVGYLPFFVLLVSQQPFLQQLFGRFLVLK